MAPRQGILTTGTQSTEGRAVRDVSPKIHQLEPNKYPLVVLMTNVEGRLSDADNYKVESYEDELLPKFDVLGSTALTAGATSMIVTNYLYFVKNQLVRIANGETVRVNATPTTTTVSITRAVGETAAAAADAGAKLQIIGSAFEEASDTGVILSTTKTNPFNYLQIFKNAVGWSGSAKSYKVYGEDDKAYDRAKAIIEHCKDIELSCLLGERYTAIGPDGQRLSTMRGVFKFISSVNVDAGGEFTEAEMEEWMRLSFRYGSEKKVGILSSKLISVINGFGRDKIRTKSGESTYGISMKEYTNSGYDLDLLRHPLLENASLTDLTGLQGMGMILDINDLSMKKAPGRYMMHSYNLQTPGNDSEKEDILSECCIMLNSEKKHGKVFGVQE